MYVGTNMHSTPEPVTKVSDLNLKLVTVYLWWSSVFTNEPSFTSHTLHERKCICDTAAQLWPDMRVAFQSRKARRLGPR